MKNITNSNDIARLIALFVAECDDLCYQIDEDEVTIEVGDSTKPDPSWNETGRLAEQTTLANDTILTIREGVQAAKGDRRCDVFTLQVDEETFLLAKI